MRFLSKIILMVLLLGATLLASDIATITALNGKAFMQRDGSKVELNIGAKLQTKDIVITGSKSKVQIIFEDETVVTLGKNSTFSIEEYLFEGNQEVVARFGMLKGAMRTITGSIGEIAPEKFSVVTKTATIGIRGTNFSVLIGEDDSNIVYCTYGAISVDFKTKEYIVEQGYYMTISADGMVKVKEFTSKDLKEMKEKNFGKSIAKHGQVSNESLLDNTKNDYSDFVVQSVTSSVKDAKDTLIDQNHVHEHIEEYIPEPVLGLTQDSVIAGYTMQDAIYEGSYTTVSNTTGSFADTGTAQLNVSFSADTAYLMLDGGGHTAIYDTNPIGFDSSTFNIGVNPSSGAVGSTSGAFYGVDGDIVNGAFNYQPGGDPGYEAVGSYDLNAIQPLN